MKSTTVYFDSHIHRALRLKAVETDRSVSDLVNEAVKLSLAEDAEDLAAFEAENRIDAYERGETKAILAKIAIRPHSVSFQRRLESRGVMR